MKIKLLKFKPMGDERGSLIALESGIHVPFDIKRVYYIFSTKENVKRGMHAHKDLKQIIVAVSGSCQLLLDDGKHKETVELSDPTQGVLVESVIWREMYDFSQDCVLMVLANRAYDPEDYIRDYNEFLEYVRKHGASPVAKAMGDR